MKSFLLPQSDLNDISPDNLPSLEEQSLKAEKIKKTKRITWFSKPQS